MTKGHTTAHTITLLADCSAVQEAIDQLKAGIDELESSAAQRFQRLLQRPDFVQQLFTVETVLGSTAADECLVRFQPSDRFGVLLTAVGTGDINRLTVK